MRKLNRKAVIFLVLFSLPFAGGGTFVAYLAGSMLTTWVQARGWQEVPARILSLNLKQSTSDGSTTYRLEATYEYAFGARLYTSADVGLSFGSDNVGSFHQDKYRELRPYFDAGRDFRCFVNPDEPTEALLFREMRGGLLGLMSIFAAAFCLVGYGLIFAGLYGSRLVAEADKRKVATPEQPWLWKKEWAGGHIRGGAKGKMIGAFIFATLWNLISAPVFFFVPDEVAAGNRMALLALIFPVVGAGLAWWAIYSLLQWRKFGKSTFEMFRVPGVLGGYLEGTIQTSVKTAPEEGFRLTLTCTRTETSGSGNNRSTTEKVLWQDTELVSRAHLGAGRDGATVPVRFGIPYDAGPESDADDSGPIKWKLEAQAAVRGVDYHGYFEVPVFRTEDSDPELELAVSGEIDSLRSGPIDLQHAGIVNEPLPSGGTSYVFSRARAKGAAFSLGCFAIIWSGAIWAMIAYDLPILFPIMFGLFDLFFVLALLDMLFTERRVEVEVGTLTFTKRMFAGGKLRTFRSEEIASIKPSRGMQSGSKLYYRIELKTREGKSHILASMLDNQRLARRIIRDFEAALAS